MDDRANLRDLAYNQMKLQYIEARSRGTARFLLPTEAEPPQRRSAADAAPSRHRAAGRRHARTARQRR